MIRRIVIVYHSTTFIDFMTILWPLIQRPVESSIAATSFSLIGIMTVSAFTSKLFPFTAPVGFTSFLVATSFHKPALSV